MPIYKLPVYQDLGWPLKNKNYNPEVLKRTMKAESIDPNLVRLLEKGKTVYVYINPYEAEIGGTQVVCGGVDLETEFNRYYLLRDEV